MSGPSLALTPSRLPRLGRSRYTRHMLQSSILRFLLAAAAIALCAAAVLPLAGCARKDATSSATPASDQAAANKDLTQYQRLLAISDAVQAAQLGEQIVRKYPGTPAAAEVQKSLPEIKARAAAQTKRRLANLWVYSAANAGGLQYTASIYTSEPPNADVQLILRRHAGWGQSVYVFGSGNGFVCRKLCDVAMSFDGKHEVWKAFPPTTGEPAIFIKDDQAFIAALEKAKVITMDVVTKDHGKQTLEFEVGGFDPAKFPSLPKQ